MWICIYFTKKYLISPSERQEKPLNLLKTKYGKTPHAHTHKIIKQRFKNCLKKRAIRAPIRKGAGALNFLRFILTSLVALVRKTRANAQSLKN